MGILNFQIVYRDSIRGTINKFCNSNVPMVTDQSK